jgi:VIT1/CCC1 family predicted Fe2+/Mn2+ transporter
MPHLDERTKKTILDLQKGEITEYFIYNKLSILTRDRNNSKVLGKIAKDELRHAGIWKKYTKQDVASDKFKYWFYVLISRIFGITFGIKLMENGEARAQLAYDDLARIIPQAGTIRSEEEAHEQQLIVLIDEERLRYIGSVVLGLNDALVELTGTLAGLTFALQNAKIIGVAGLITGIAASLSMAASEYLSTKTESEGKDPLKASIYTGCTYVIAVSVLILPFLLLQNYYLALGIALADALFLIFIFTFYFSVVRGISFRARFLEMAGISLGVAALSFGIGLLVRNFLGVAI